MSISVPRELDALVFLCVGEQFPRGDEDRMAELGEVWRRLGDNLAVLDGRLAQVSALLTHGGDAPGVMAARDVVTLLRRQLRMDGGPFYWDTCW